MAWRVQSLNALHRRKDEIVLEKNTLDAEACEIDEEIRTTQEDLRNANRVCRLLEQEAIRRAGRARQLLELQDGNRRVGLLLELQAKNKEPNYEAEGVLQVKNEEPNYEAEGVAEEAQEYMKETLALDASGVARSSHLEEKRYIKRKYVADHGEEYVEDALWQTMASVMSPPWCRPGWHASGGQHNPFVRWFMVITFMVW